MVDLAVSGSASVRIAPERGTAVLRVRTSDEERGPAVERATRAHARLVADARAFVASGAATRWSADQVRVRAEDHWDDGEAGSQRLQVAGGTVTVRFADAGALAEWLGAIGSLEDVDVVGIEWSLTSERLAVAERQVRSEAVSDARERAVVYAAALGLGAPEVVALYEPGLRPSVTNERPARFAWTAQSARGMDGDDAGWTLNPQDIEVTAELSLDCTAS